MLLDSSPGRFGGNLSIFRSDIFWGTMDGVEEPFRRMWPFRFKERKQFVIRNALIHIETSQLECCISETRELVSRSLLAPQKVSRQQVQA